MFIAKSIGIKEETDFVLTSSNNKVLVVNSALIGAKSTKNSIGVSANLGMGAGYSLAFAYALSWTNITRSISLVYASKNDGVYVSFDVEFQINHLATAAVAAACVYWPALSPVLYQLLAKSKAAALGAMTVLAPIVRYAYA